MSNDRQWDCHLFQGIILLSYVYNCFKLMTLMTVVSHDARKFAYLCIFHEEEMD